ncbi:MAG: hypothetical protein CL912_08915 [Deltaproteobacteria bacterium]|nr:hypothetical protein [Deltaproteobacteria bacterium]
MNARQSLLQEQLRMSPFLSNSTFKIFCRSSIQILHVRQAKLASITPRASCLIRNSQIWYFVEVYHTKLYQKTFPNVSCKIAPSFSLGRRPSISNPQL